MTRENENLPPKDHNWFLSEDSALTRSDPFNVRVMDVDTFISNHNIDRVTSPLIQEPSSINFHPDGLFSEEIFGQIGTPDRLTRFGDIELNTTIIAPVLFQTMIKMSKMYQEIMSGHLYAVFDQESGDFTPIYDDPEEVPDCNTGFSFFLRCFPYLKFKETGSQTRSISIKLIEKYKDIAFYNRYLVSPAGTRDIASDESGKLIQDDINKLYLNLLTYTFSIPPNSQSPLYDSIRYTIQLKCVEIFEYLENMMTGKNGFLQGHYGQRKIALGTRNVITASGYGQMRPDDPQLLKVDETAVGLFQTMKGLQPLTYHFFRIIFIETVFGLDEIFTIPLINTKTYKLEYQNISNEERSQYTSQDGIASWINRFKNVDVRNKPIIIRNTQKESFYLFLVYDTGDSIYLFRSIEDLENLYPNYNKSYIRPLTWVEAFYMATYQASIGRHCFITRYPVLGDGSNYPSKIHLVTTSPGRVISLYNLADQTQEVVQYPEYPVLENSYQDSVVLSVSRLAGLGGDHDGDTVSVNFIMSEDSNDEVMDYLNSPKSLIDTQKRLVSGSATDTINLCIHNLSLMDTL